MQLSPKLKNILKKTAIRCTLLSIPEVKFENLLYEVIISFDKETQFALASYNPILSSDLFFETFISEGKLAEPEQELLWSNILKKSLELAKENCKKEGKFTVETVDALAYMLFNENNEFFKKSKAKGFEIDREEASDIILSSLTQVQFVENMSEHNMGFAEKLEVKKQQFGYESECADLIQNLLRNRKFNSIVTSDSAEKCSNLINLLSYKINTGDIVSYLGNHSIFNVDNSIFFGVQYKGELEVRLIHLIESAIEKGSCVLVFNEIKNILSMGQDLSECFLSVIDKYAKNTSVRMILNFDSKSLESVSEINSDFLENFNIVKLKSLSKEDCSSFLIANKSDIQKNHNITFTKTWINGMIDICYENNLQDELPNLAFEIMDEIGSKSFVKKAPKSFEVNEAKKEFHSLLISIEEEEREDIDKLEKINKYVDDLATNLKLSKRYIAKKSDLINSLSKISGISEEALSSKKANFLNFEKDISKEIFGQPLNIKKAYETLLSAKAGISPKNQPLAKMIFAGPTSVGKTYLAKKIAKYFYGKESSVVQINLSENQDATGVSKLIGSSAGYVGYEDGGLLTDAVKANPNSVVIFDESDKADPKVLNLLLSILDEGYLHDGANQKIDFTNCIVILTTNTGQLENSKKSMGFINDKNNLENKEKNYKEALKKNLKPELLSRISDVLIFNDLSDKEFEKIFNVEWKNLLNKLKDLGIKTKISPKVKREFLCSSFKNPRELKESFNKKITSEFSKEIILHPDKKELNIHSKNGKIIVE